MLEKKNREEVKVIPAVMGRNRGTQLIPKIKCGHRRKNSRKGLNNKKGKKGDDVAA